MMQEGLAAEDVVPVDVAAGFGVVGAAKAETFAGAAVAVEVHAVAAVALVVAAAANDVLVARFAVHLLPVVFVPVTLDDGRLPRQPSVVERTVASAEVRHPQEEGKVRLLPMAAVKPTGDEFVPPELNLPRIVVRQFPLLADQ